MYCTTNTPIPGFQANIPNSSSLAPPLLGTGEHLVGLQSEPTPALQMLKPTALRFKPRAIQENTEISQKDEDMSLSESDILKTILEREWPAIPHEFLLLSFGDFL
jgi:hypothetical protein